MADALQAYADRLRNEVEQFSALIDDMKAGRQKSSEVDTASGRVTDTTAQRITDFERIVQNLNEVISEIETKTGQA